jgi:regulator of protease activity HflC (stomatin/prohibitin superfamily)
MEPIVAIVIAVFGVFFLSKAVYIVRQSQVVLIERLGKYNRTLTSGVNPIIPFFENPRDIRWIMSGGRRVQIVRIDLRETVYDLNQQSVITKDNVVVGINALMYIQITDPVRAAYEIADLPEAIEKLTQTTLRNLVGELNLDETFASRDRINERLQAILDEATNKWGLKVNRVEVQEIIPPLDIREALEKQMRAERDRRAIVLEAEGQKSSEILRAEGVRDADVFRAEGERKAAILRAEGQAQARVLASEAEAESIRRVTAAIAQSGADPATYLITIKYLETLKELSAGNNNKLVFLPYEATAALGSLGAIREILGAQDVGPDGQIRRIVRGGNNPVG